MRFYKGISTVYSSLTIIVVSWLMSMKNSIGFYSQTINYSNKDKILVLLNLMSFKRDPLFNLILQHRSKIHQMITRRKKVSHKRHPSNLVSKNWRNKKAVMNNISPKRIAVNKMLLFQRAASPKTSPKITAKLFFNSSGKMITIELKCSNILILMNNSLGILWSFTEED